MGYKVIINDFEGPLDLLLHLIKESNIDIFDIKIEEITKQYFDFIHKMEEMNLNIASEYLIMAAELIEMKSSILLPKKESSMEDSYEEDPREQLIERLLAYQQYKDLSLKLKEMEEGRRAFYTKEPTDLSCFEEKKKIEEDINVDLLMQAFLKLLEKKELMKPIPTRIATKEYSVEKRSAEIKEILKKKKKVSFLELFDVITKDFVVVTFLSILNLARNQELCICQEQNFNTIYLEEKGV